MITGIQKGDSAGTNGGADSEASLNSLKLNNLSGSLSSASVSTAKLTRQCFDRLDSGTFGPKGTYMYTYSHILLCIHMYVYTYIWQLSYMYSMCVVTTQNSVKNNDWIWLMYCDLYVYISA